jgi:hypothetical protein
MSLFTTVLGFSLIKCTGNTSLITSSSYLEVTLSLTKLHFQEIILNFVK